MDLALRHPVLAALLVRRRVDTTPDWRRQLATASRLTAQLPLLVRGWAPARPLHYDEALLHLEIALRDVAAKRRVPVEPGTAPADVAACLSAAGAIVPPARDAATQLVGLLHAGARGAVEDLTIELDALAVTGRLLAYLELRAGFG